MDSQIIGAIISATATIIAATIAGLAAIKVKDLELKIREEKTGELLSKAEKKAARWLWGLIGAGIGAGIVLAIMTVSEDLSFSSLRSPATQTSTVLSSAAESNRGLCPVSSNEAARIWGGPANLWKTCPGEQGCWTFSDLGSYHRLSVHKSYLLSNNTIEGWRFGGQGGDDPKGAGFPGSPDSIEGDYYIWEKLEGATIRCEPS